MDESEDKIESGSDREWGSFVEKELRKIDGDYEAWAADFRERHGIDTQSGTMESPEGPKSPDQPTSKGNQGVIMEIDEDIEAVLRGVITKEEYYRRKEERDEREVKQNVHYVPLDDE